MRASLAVIALFAAMVSLPGLVALSGLSVEAPLHENRAPAPSPPWPPVAQEPSMIDAWWRDHLPFRATAVRLGTRLRHASFRETPTRQTVFGPTGRLFLTSHDAARPFSLVAAICGGPDDTAQTVAAIAALVGAAGPDSLFVAVPTAPALYGPDLPGWLARQCQGPSAMDRIVAAGAPALYPIDALRAALRAGDVIPRYNFHWSGRGARAVAEVVAQRWGLPRRRVVQAVDVIEDSDLARFVPGLDLRDRATRPDPAASGIALCYARPACLPELGDITSVVDDYTRVAATGGAGQGGRLLVIGDSFASFVAPWLAAWFDEVWHVSANNFGRLTDAQRARLRSVLLDVFRPDKVLFLFHDGAVSWAPQALRQQMWPHVAP